MIDDKTEGGIYAPCYYNEFKCLAAGCRHSCCIGWEICIDDQTYEKYRQCADILGTVKEGEDGVCFALGENGRCPHLNNAGLCNIILSHGEDYLSEICRNHPRFFNYISNNRIEAGLGIVCEEACRLILENDKPFSLLKTAELDNELSCIGDTDDIYLYEPGLDRSDCFDPLPLRDRIVSQIESDGSFDKKLAALKAEYKLPDPYPPDIWLDRFLSLEILEPAWERDLSAMKGRFLQKSHENNDNYDRFYKRLLTYFVYRHVSAADTLDSLCSRAAFCILSAEAIRSLFEASLTGESRAESEKVPEKLIDWARRYSAEIEYSEDNTAELIFAFESELKK